MARDWKSEMTLIQRQEIDRLISTKERCFLTKTISTQTTGACRIEDTTTIDQQDIFWRHQTPANQPGTDIVNINGTDFGCSDCSLDTIFSLKCCSYAVVYGPGSRHNFAATLDGVTSTTVGETVGAREGIIKYFKDISTNNATDRLIWLSDNENTVRTLNKMIEHARGIDINQIDKDFYDLEIELACIDMDYERVQMLLQLFKLHGDRIQIRWIKAHVSVPVDIPTHLNILADLAAKDELTKYHRNFPMVLGQEGARNALDRLMSNQNWLQY